jgi:hypothetical protein
VANARDTKRHRKRLSLKFGIEAPTRVAFTEDISRFGMCIKTASVSPPGSRLKIELTLPDGNLVKIEGIVVWAKKVPPNMINLIKKCGMGLKFTKIDAGEGVFENLCDELYMR